jgi:hypothetical protein
VLEGLVVGHHLLGRPHGRELADDGFARPLEAPVAPGPRQPHRAVASPVDQLLGERDRVTGALAIGVVRPVDEAGVGQVGEAHRPQVVPQVAGGGRAELVRAHRHHVAGGGLGVDSGRDLAALGPVGDHVVATPDDAQPGHHGQHHGPGRPGADGGHPEAGQQHEQGEDHREVAAGEGRARHPADARAEDHGGRQHGRLGPGPRAGAEVELHVAAVEGPAEDREQGQDGQHRAEGAGLAVLASADLDETLGHHLGRSGRGAPRRPRAAQLVEEGGQPRQEEHAAGGDRGEHPQGGGPTRA